jgi:tetratricopeptide (TPR) repeat protein
MPMSNLLKLALRFTLCLLALTISTFAQDAKAPNAAPTCNRESALIILDEQIAATRTFDDQAQRVAVLIRAADLVWPHSLEKSRAAFAEAFDIAVRDYKEKGDETSHEGLGLAISVPDQRYMVINAIAKRDLTWARRLTDEILSDEQSQTREKNTKSEEQKLRTAEKLLSLASSFSASNQTAALSFARSSLQYPATFYLPMFLYKLAEVNQVAADSFYVEALTAYARAPMDRLLYLSAYPFGNDSEVGEMPGYTIYTLPAKFSPNPNLQRALVKILLGRVQQRLGQPPDTFEANRVSDAGQMWLALTALEKQIQRTLPDLAPQVEQAKGNVLGLLPPGSQRGLSQRSGQTSNQVGNFNEQVELAEKNPRVDQRDSQIVAAVTGASANEDLDLVLRVIDKVSESVLRPQLLNWLYFNRTQSAIKNKQFTEARQLAAKVEELDQRAFLYFRIAQESLKENVDQTQAREMLDEVVDNAAKAPPTLVTARAQLGVAYLYTKLDVNRAIAVLGDAVKSINRIEEPDFSRQFVIRRIEGKSFGTYAGFATPGFNAENTFGELGKVDFEGTLYQAGNLTNKSLRARTTLALIDPCLQQPDKAKKKVKEVTVKPSRN